MAGREGIEPPAVALTVRCSAFELPARALQAVRIERTKLPPWLKAVEVDRKTHLGSQFVHSAPTVPQGEGACQVSGRGSAVHYTRSRVCHSRTATVRRAESTTVPKDSIHFHPSTISWGPSPGARIHG